MTITLYVLNCPSYFFLTSLLPYTHLNPFFYFPRHHSTQAVDSRQNYFNADLITYNLKIIMKRKQLNNYNQTVQSQQLQNNSSDVAIEYSKLQNIVLPPLKTQMELEEERKRLMNGKREGLDHLYRENYQPAKYSRALEYRNSRSYLKKLPNGQYEELALLASTDQLRYFGIGTYLFIEFMRRVTWLFFVVSLMVVVTIVVNWQGSAMSSYSSSFSTYLIKSTIGNYTRNALTSIDGYLVTIIPAVIYFITFIFYLVWKKHYFRTIADQQTNTEDVKPQKFCLEIDGLDEESVGEDQLSKFFSTFGPVYEVSLIRRHKNKLSYFQQLQTLEGIIKEMELEVILGGGDKEKLQKLKEEKQKLQAQISTMQIHPKIISAYVHFQFQKSKTDCLNYFNNHYLFRTCSHSCVRNCCCCIVIPPQEKYLFKGQALAVRNDKVPSPEDINWGTFQLTLCGRLTRGLIAFLVILIFLGVTCSIVGLCSIYIASHASNCQNVTVPSTLAQAQASTDSTAVQCYCDANLVSALSDSDVKAVCSPYLSNIYASQAIQYAVIFTSSFTNFLFGLIVDRLVQFVRPASKSSGMLARTSIYTLFLIFNTILIPLLVYANIFGFQPSNYISFITIISTDVSNFFNVSSISFYPHFTTVWYRNVSVIYVNYLIVNTVVVWLMFLKDKFSAGKKSLEEQEGKILQKHMNQQITAYRLDIFQEAANFYLVIILCALFGAGIPVLLPLGFLNLVSRYVADRSLLQYSSTRIDGLGEEFTSLTLVIFPAALTLGPLVGEWMLVGNSDIYPNILPMSFPYLQGHFYELDLQLYLPFYLLISLLVFCQFFLFNTLIRFVSFLCSLCYQTKQVQQPYHTRPFSEYAKGMNILYSYNIKNNDEMRNVMLKLEKYLVQKEDN